MRRALLAAIGVVLLFALPHMLSALPIPGLPDAWLSHGTIMWVLIIVSVWTFFPFVLVNVLARLQTIPPELYDARAHGLRSSTVEIPAGNGSSVTVNSFQPCEMGCLGEAGATFTSRKILAID